MATGKGKSILLGGVALLGGIAVMITDAYARVDEIIVTATRREESLQKVPVAVSVLGADALVRQNIDSAMDLTGKVPSLLVAPAPGLTQASLSFSIRGLAQNEATHVADPSVSVYINEIAVPRTHGANAAMFDLESVQVLRGPQGTLFGRNTTGGAVLVTTARPVDETFLSLSASAASYQTYNFEGVGNTRIGDFANVRIAAVKKLSDGYIKDVVNNQIVNDKDETGVRLSVDINPTNKWNSLFVASFTNIDDGGSGIKQIAKTGIAFNPTLGQLETASGIKQFAKLKIWDITNSTNISITDSLTIKNIMGYRNLRMQNLEDSDGTAAFLLPQDRHTKQDQFSEELQLQGDHGWGNWILGGYYFSEDGDDGSATSGVFTGCGAFMEDPTSTDLRSYTCYQFNRNLVTNTSYAAFGDVSFNLGAFVDALSGFTLDGGVRYNYDKRKMVVLNQHSLGGCSFTIDDDNDPSTPEVKPSPANCRLPVEADFSAVTYNIDLKYQVTDDFLLYVAHRHGYRTGGFGARATTEAGLKRTFDPEFVDDVEIGAKTVWNLGDGYLTANLALYRNSYKDIQRILTDPTTIPIQTVPVNAGKARIRGGELEVSYSLPDWFEFSGFYSNTDAAFIEFITPDGTDLSNDKFARAPKNIYGVSARVFMPVPDTCGEISIGTSFSHIDKFKPSDTAAGIAPFGERDLLSFTVDWENIKGSNVTASFFVDNALNDEYYNPALPIAPTTLNSAIVGEPRMFGGRISVRFNG